MAKFGPSQLLNPTPATARKVFHVYFVVTTIIALAFECFHQIPQHFVDTVNAYVVSTNGFVFGLTRLFGISPDEVKPTNP